MAQDLSTSPTTGITVQACGDMHLSNFGVFASAERSLVFGINDFDETLPGAWEWDLKRLVASIVVAVRFLGGDRVVAEAAARAAVASYRERMAGSTPRWATCSFGTRPSKTRTFSLCLSPEISEREPSPVFAKAKKRGHLQVLEKMTSLVDEKQRIIEEAPLIVRERRTQQGRPIVEAVGILLHEYLQSLGHDSTTPSLQVPIGGCGSESGGSRKRRNTLLGDSPQGEQASAIRFSFSLKRLSPRSWRPISRPRFFKTKAGAS